MRKIDVVMPYLAQSSGKAFFVEFRCWNESSNKMERTRIYKGFNGLDDQQREIHADKIIKEYSEKLSHGWRPWQSDKFIYRDEVEYRNITMNFGVNRIDSSHLRKHMSQFLEKIKKELSPKSFESYQSKTRMFCIYLEKKGFGDKPLYEISNEKVREFFVWLIDTKKLDKVTVRKYRQNISAMFRYFKEKNLIQVLPTDNLPNAPKRKDDAARPMIDRDVKKYLEYTQENDPQMFLAAMMEFFLCCRPGEELRRMKIGDLDLFNKNVYIRFDTGKTGKRVITMPEALVEVCNHYNLSSYNRDWYIFSTNGEPGRILLGKNYFSRKFREYRTILKFPSSYKFYSFKHTGAGKLLETGCTFPELMAHLGHSNFESTIHYVKRHFGERSEKISSFNPEMMKGFI